MPKLYLELTSKFTLNPADAADEGYHPPLIQGSCEDYTIVSSQCCGGTGKFSASETDA